MRRVIQLLAVFLLLSAVYPVAAASAERGDYLTLKVAVMGPGDAVYFWWGHIALVVEDALTGETRFFDYGLFSFEAEDFYRNFAFGRLYYYCGVSPAEPNYRGYRRTNRDITLYTLDLPAQKKAEILRFVENNTLPENSVYNYHHFRDNCSTRIRDIIDMATDGAFRAAFGGAPGRFTLRGHVRRHTYFNPFFDWFLNFLMGQGIDTPITVWEELFLPGEVGDRIRDFSWRGADGAERRLVSRVEAVNRAEGRPPVLAVPRRQWPRELVFGLFLAAAVLFVRFLGRFYPVFTRVFLGVFQALWGLFFGAAGTVLFFMTFFTNHDYTWHNINVIFINPLLFAAVPAGIISASGKSSRGAARVLTLLWSGVFLGGSLTLILRFFPPFYQQNQVTLAMTLPVALVFCAGPAARLFARGGKKP
ncbi:MAG: DUF4105 domain-containing protein [Spirochaetaceae bacterium]|nr:DUF4105 domain-containing protein [Spirochaetaceae bacterium]